MIESFLRSDQRVASTPFQVALAGTMTPG